MEPINQAPWLNRSKHENVDILVDPIFGHNQFTFRNIIITTVYVLHCIIYDVCSKYTSLYLKKKSIRGKGIPCQNLACFVRYLKIINTFFEINIGLYAPWRKSSEKLKNNIVTVCNYKKLN